MPSASLSPLTAYCVACEHADGLTSTAAPSLAYPILHGATLEGGACGWGRGGRFGWVSSHFVYSTVGTVPIFLTNLPVIVRAGSFASSEEGGEDPPASETVRGQTAEVLSRGCGTSLVKLLVGFD